MCNIVTNQAIMMITIIGTLFWMLTTSGALETILLNQSIEDGETIVSQNGTFELGFFSPGNSKNRYLGIWYKKITSTIIWVANSDTPLKSTLGVFMFNRKQMLLMQNGTIIWSFDFMALITDKTAVAILWDNGNFVIKGRSNKNFIWQSFDYPGNTFLPGMKFGKNFITGKERYMKSWRSRDDPSPGEYTMRWKMDEYPQVYKMKGPVTESRMGPWNGESYAGLPIFSQNQISTFKTEIVTNQEESYFLYTLISTKVLERATLTEDGKMEFCHHDRDSESQDWMQDWNIPLDNCDSYDMCGPYGSCNILTSPYCGCLKGFKPAAGSRVDEWSNGCKRMIALDCKHVEDFLKYPGVKLPDTKGALFNEHMTLGECAVACKNNCSCIAYANPYISPARNGCLRWFGDLIDIRVYPQNGQDLYIRLAASEVLRLQSEPNKKKRLQLEVYMSVSAVMIVLSMILALYLWIKWKRSNVNSDGSEAKLLDADHEGSIEMGETHLPLFGLSTIAKATNNFSNDNKLGEGGFGPVYKGVLEEGGEIAVKRLSKRSRQGLVEFQNEVICIAKLQHRNLVKLLGYCLQGEEMMLIYEYMPNKSLDHLLFDENKSLFLDWRQRYHIINGIARGLLYLHQDSRLRIIHRDLKASNILLDSNMNPKISDFGLARMFKEYETEANTNIVVGTLGYISPEYAANGLFSVKSDVFSFGVLVLEIVSGKKNRGFTHQDHHDNLLGHAWRLYKEDKALELVDIALGDSWTVSEVLQSIHVGLSCVQQHAEDRPSMSSVIHMLSGEGALPAPTQPGFFTEVPKPELKSIIPLVSISINEVTITQLDAR